MLARRDRAPRKSPVRAQTDHAGHTTIATRTYRVVWPFAIRQPVDALPVVNKAQAGSSVPLKFTLGGDRGLTVLAGGPTSGAMTCASGATVDSLEETATSAASGLSYDAVTGVYSWIWKTQKSWSGTCRQLVLSLSDSNVMRFNFTFVK